jgi:hypothetical protein
MLTDTMCRNAKEIDKIHDVTDEKGLRIEVYPNGSEYQRFTRSMPARRRG